MEPAGAQTGQVREVRLVGARMSLRLLGTGPRASLARVTISGSPETFGQDAVARMVRRLH